MAEDVTVGGLVSELVALVRERGHGGGSGSGSGSGDGYRHGHGHGDEDGDADGYTPGLEHGRGHARLVVGLVGPPGAGKSTLARALVDGVGGALGPGVAAYVPMDGFHLSNEQLARIGWLDRKGAPPTFDAWGYAALLGRLGSEPEHDVFVPDYDRVVDQPIAARHVVAPSVRLVVAEGNYLAVDTPEWRAVRSHVDVLWYVDAPDEVREQRLFARQRAGGRDAAAARDWVERSDRPNGEVVKETAGRCDRVLWVSGAG